jgi:hypothetical protein
MARQTFVNPHVKGGTVNLREILRGKHEAPSQAERHEPAVMAAVPLPTLPHSSMQRVDVRTIRQDAYQRPVDMARVRRMVKNWEPLDMGHLVISRRNDGSEFVIDGHHRITAILLMEGRVPYEINAIVWEGLSPQQEARMFAAQSSKHRRPVLPEEIHNAMVYAEDAQATRINTIVESSGFRLGTGSSEKDVHRLKAVKRLYDIEDRYGPDVLSSALGVITAAWGTDHVPEGPLVDGVAQFIAMYPQANYPSLIKRLAKTPMGHWVIEADNGGGKAIGLRSKTDRITHALHVEYNKTHSKNKIETFDKDLKAHKSHLRSAGTRRGRAK